MRAPKSFFILVLTVFLCLLPLSAQIHGVPASITSYGFGGNISPAPGVPASVTSLGPNGYSFFPSVNGPCCFNSFFPGHQFSSSPRDQFSHFDLHSLHRRNHFGPIFSPAYAVPYAYPVAVPLPVPEAYVDDESDESYVPDDTPPLYERRRVLQKKRDLNVEPEPVSNAADSQPLEEPVASQPTTTLIFKDGHKLDVENYAIVGGTLFEFSDGRTHKFQLADLDLPATQKANDDRGVEFHAPSGEAQ